MHRNCNAVQIIMKSASLPSIRVEAEFREELEGALAEGETVSAFVEASVRQALRKRQIQAEFVARGMASLVAVREGEATYSVEEVASELRARTAAARAKQAKARKTT